MPPTSIDGTDITGATIDGTDVQEITVDGQTVFSAGPTVIQDYESGLGGASVVSGPASISTTSVASQGSTALQAQEGGSNSTVKLANTPTFTGTIRLLWDRRNKGDFVQYAFLDNNNDFSIFRFRVLDNTTDVLTGGSGFNMPHPQPTGQYQTFSITLDFDNQTVSDPTIDGQTVSGTEPFLGSGGTQNGFCLNNGDQNNSTQFDFLRFEQL